MKSLMTAGLIALALPLATLPQTALAERGHQTSATPGFCPPGLARKDPPCVPPGQARSHGDDWGDRYRIGARVTRDQFRYLDPFYDRTYGLPPLPTGQRYAVIDGRIVVLDQTTYEIVDLIRAVTAVLD